jgi:hypothetical protein
VVWPKSYCSLNIIIENISSAFQQNFPDVDAPKGDHDLLPLDAADSQAPEIVLEPENFPHTAEHVQRIADLENQVKMLK